MLKNYLKTTFRKLIKDKVYSLIKIIGLAISIATSLLIFLWINDELNYDSYHKDVNQIFRVAEEIKNKSGSRYFAPICGPAGPALKEKFPQIEYVARIYTWGDWLVKYEDRVYYENKFMWADKDIFNILSIPFIKGNPSKALEEPGTIVISERMAEKYFGNEDPYGKILNINGVDYTITGIVKNSPTNTHVKYDLIGSLLTIDNWYTWTNWYGTECFTYIKLVPGVNADSFEKQMCNIADLYVGEQLKEWGTVFNFFLQPIIDIHLFSHLIAEVESPGNLSYIYIFSIIGLFILLIGSINFMNLSTAKHVSHSKEVGIRKVIGGTRSKLIIQFLTESILLSFIALNIALYSVEFLLPAFNNFTGKELDIGYFTSWGIIPGLLGFSLLIGIFSGSYPAFVLSAFKPVFILKNITTGSSRSIIRKVLVMGQFAISVILIICTITLYQQLFYMKSQYLGFEKDQKLIIPVKGGISISENYENIKNEFLNYPSISGATVSSSVPGRGTSSFAARLSNQESNQNLSINHLRIDFDFIPEYKIELVAGRLFSKEIKSDISDFDQPGTGAFIINETAVKALGLSSPHEAIGKQMYSGHGGRFVEIIGVVKDFHYRGLQTNIEPLMMEILPSRFNKISLTVNTNMLDKTLSSVKNKWQELFPDNPFDYFFLDEDFDRQYQFEEKAGKMISIFTILAIFVAYLGLYGLASFSAERRTKEIGIRKVLGASAYRITLITSKEYLKWIIFGNIIAWPTAYFFINKWLQNFAYRINISWLIFIIALISVIFIAFISVSYQSIKAANKNPAESLRYE